MTDKKGKCRFCGTEAYETEEEATRKLIQVYRNLDRQREAWAIDVIKAAVQAWDLVTSGNCPDKTSDGQLLNLDEAIVEFMHPHLEALKGLIDD
jgi:microcompartment protein CcmK/EutM